MSVARGFGLNGKSFYTNIAKPMEVNLSFTVTPTNGLGVTSVKSNGYVNNVFMHTSTTPTANNGYTNPNPANGFALIQLKQNFNVFLGMRASFVTPTATSTQVDNTALTVGQVYVISTLGNTTAAQWLTLGVPPGVTPAVGVAFAALLTGVAGQAGTSTSRVMLPTTAGVYLAEIVGTTNVMTSSNIASNAGQWVTVQFSAAGFTGSALGTHTHTLNLKNAAVSDGATTRVNAGSNLLGANTGSDITIAGGGASGGIAAVTAGTPAGTMAQVVTAPATASICNMSLYFDGSTVTIDGL